MAELTEIIPLENLKLLSRMTLQDYTNFANKKKHKMNDIKEHYKQIMQ